jgi:16S rRNA (guanine527-N7)-methyltransferase
MIRSAPEFAQAFAVSRETLARLETYAALLTQWQKTINLVASSTLPDVWQRHFADSAQLVALTPPNAKGWLDLGSGAGFPGMVVAILLAERPKNLTSRVTLIESDSRKAAFLREVARHTGVAVDIVCGRIESPATQSKVGRIDVVTSRALAPLDRLLEWAQPFFLRDSKGLFLKGRDVEGEVTEARKRWTFDCRLVPSTTDPQGRIAVIENLGVRPEG